MPFLYDILSWYRVDLHFLNKKLIIGEGNPGMTMVGFPFGWAISVDKIINVITIHMQV